MQFVTPQSCQLGTLWHTGPVAMSAHLCHQVSWGHISLWIFPFLQERGNQDFPRSLFWKTSISSCVHIAATLQTNAVICKDGKTVCPKIQDSQHTTPGLGKYLLSSGVNLHEPDTVGLLLCWPSSSSISILSKDKKRDKYHIVSYSPLLANPSSLFLFSLKLCFPSVSPSGRFFLLLMLPVLCYWWASQLAEWSEIFSPNQWHFAVTVTLPIALAERLNSRECPRYHFPITPTALEVKCLKPEKYSPCWLEPAFPGRQKAGNEPLLVSGCP